MYCILYGGMYLPTYKGCERTFGETGKLCIYSPSSYLCLKKSKKETFTEEENFTFFNLLHPYVFSKLLPFVLK